VKDQVVDGVAVDSVVVGVVVVTLRLVLGVVVESGLQRDRPNRLNEESIESEIELLLLLTKLETLSAPTVDEKSAQVLGISLGAPLVFHKLVPNESFHSEDVD